MSAEKRNRGRILLSLLLLCGVLFLAPMTGSAQEKVGVLFAIHGGFDQYSRQHLWDASMQMFSYEPNHTVYKFAIWCPSQWPLILDTENAIKEIPKYAFEYARLGGTDPFGMLTKQQYADLIAELGKNTCDVTFETDWVGWMSGDDPSHYVYPRFIYNKPAGWNPPLAICTSGPSDVLDYCGVGDNGDPNPWPGCDPQRFNVDGPVERLLNKGVSQIILIDLTVGGMRFSKTYDIFKKIKLCLNDHGQGSMPVTWINDYNNLMQNSYPTDPATWTPQLSYNQKKGPTVDPSVPLLSNPNPITTDPVLMTLNVEGIEAGMNPSVPASQTGILLLNHALVDWAEYFDPKIDDTVALNQSVEASLLARHPGMDPANIVGAYMGIKEIGSAEGGPATGVELTRNMRGENLGYAWLYETPKLLPSGKWGYRYWDALEYLKNRGVQHIVIGFPQIITDSVLNLVEIPNQIGKEIGIKTWLKWGVYDFITYPGVGHPFADYWGNWAETNVCGEWKLNYKVGTVKFTAGAMLTGQTSHATAEIQSFTGTVVSGTFTLKKVVGTFVTNEILTDSSGGSAKANGTQTVTIKPDCCFTMGGCGDPLRPYPPRRQSTDVRSMLDPSLAYDLSDYGHLGYDPALGAPNPDMPVQNQYIGTWDMYRPASADPRVGEMLAQHVLNEFVCTPIVPTVINLADLRAIAGHRKVTLSWTTASEIDTAGFNVYRSTDENGAYVKINSDLIKAIGSPGAGAAYQFADTAARNRKTCWYQLEDIDLSGTATMHGPVSATPKLRNLFK